LARRTGPAAPAGTGTRLGRRGTAPAGVRQPACRGGRRHSGRGAVRLDRHRRRRAGRGPPGTAPPAPGPPARRGTRGRTAAAAHRRRGAGRAAGGPAPDLGRGADLQPGLHRPHRTAARPEHRAADQPEGVGTAADAARPRRRGQDAARRRVRVPARRRVRPGLVDPGRAPWGRPPRRGGWRWTRWTGTAATSACGTR